MTGTVTVESVRGWFDRFIQNSLSEEMRVDPMITIKLEHSGRVARICRELANEMAWPKDEADAAEIVGILHDVGRFAQVAEFGTFRDAHSFNHGERGYETVLAAGVLDGMPEPIRTGVLDGIRCHNLREIPRDVIEGPGRHLAKIIRDADKLDIYFVIGEALKSNSLRERLTTALKIDYDAPLSRDAIDDVLGGETVANDHIHSAADFQLMQISWVFDIYYRPTFVRIDQSGVIEDIIERIPKDGEDVENAIATIREALAQGSYRFCNNNATT